MLLRLRIFLSIIGILEVFWSLEILLLGARAQSGTVTMSSYTSSVHSTPIDDYPPALCFGPLSPPAWVHRTLQLEGSWKDWDCINTNCVLSGCIWTELLSLCLYCALFVLMKYKSLYDTQKPQMLILNGYMNHCVCLKSFMWNIWKRLLDSSSFVGSFKWLKIYTFMYYLMFIQFFLNSMLDF